LLSTPAANRSGGTAVHSYEKAERAKPAHSFTHKQPRNIQLQAKKKSKYRPHTTKAPKEKTEADQLFEESEERLNDIMSKYRDRAAERRKNEVSGIDVELRAKLAGGLRAFQDDEDFHEDRREKEIRVSSNTD
jgi:hypothetical protein